MSDKYFIRGTITVRVDGSKSYIRITPCVGFLTPDKSAKAIAFPLSPTEKNIARLIKLLDEKFFVCKCECECCVRKNHLPALLDIAGQQKPVELHLIKGEEIKSTEPTKAKEFNWKIVGFVFPVL